MPIFPGTEPPTITQGNTIEHDGFAEKKMTIFSHIGTHIDAPAHILADQPTLDQLAIDQFYGRAICMDLSSHDGTIEKSHLEPFQRQIADTDFIIFATGWSKYWGDARYFENFPVLSVDAAGYLCRHSLKGIGFDTISADTADSQSLPIHNILLKEMIIIENLTNLNMVAGRTFLFSCLPLKIENGDGSPVRAIAILS